MPNGPGSLAVVRPFAGKDGDGVRTLILGIQRGEFAMDIGIDDQPDLMDIGRSYRVGDGNFWVSDREGAIIGTVGLLDIGGHEGALRKMFVAGEFRGRANGLADRLLDTLLAWSREKGLRRIYLGSAERLRAAHKFYRRRGFREIDMKSLPPSFPIMTVDTRFFMIDL